MGKTFKGRPFSSFYKHVLTIIRGLGSLLYVQNHNHHTLLQGIIYKLHNYKKIVASSKITTPYTPSEENCISVSTQRVKRKLELMV